MFLTPAESILVLQKSTPPVSQSNKVFTLRSADILNAKVATGNEEPSVLRIKFVGANPDPQMIGLEQLPGKINYFIGKNPKKWRTNVSTYTKVRYQNVYPGVDLVVHAVN